MRVVDYHTEGEPTRLIIDGEPLLGGGPLSERRRRFAAEFEHVRRIVINEPLGHDALVGALLCEPEDPSCAAGLIFFNNVGYLGMCGHATIGAAVTLAHLGRIGLGWRRFETPVGVVRVDLRDKNYATIENVESRRHSRAVAVEVEGLGRVTGDVGWGGNWFFLTDDAPRPRLLENIPALSRAGRAILDSLARQGVTGEAGAEIDHIEFSALLGRPTRTAAISCSAQVGPTTARPAAPGPAPSSLASPRVESFDLASFGFRKA